MVSQSPQSSEEEQACQDAECKQANAMLRDQIDLAVSELQRAVSGLRQMLNTASSWNLEGLPDLQSCLAEFERGMQLDAEQRAWASSESISATDDSASDVDTSARLLCYRCPKCDAVAKGFQDTSKEGLRARTRLDDVEFWDTPQSKSYIRHRTIHRLSCPAYREAQSSLWHALRQRWPQLQVERYAQGPELVRFGMTELSKVFNNSEVPITHPDLCPMPSLAIQSACFGVTPRRNEVCHPGQPNSRRVDDLMGGAHSLAVMPQDERSAAKIRALRDELQMHAKEAWERIIAQESAYHLPATKTWAIHHQYTFRDVMEWVGYYNEDFPESLAPEVRWCHSTIVQAAKTWASIYGDTPGFADPEIVKNLAKKEAHFRELEGHDISKYTEISHQAPQGPTGNDGDDKLPQTQAKLLSETHLKGEKSEDEVQHRSHQWLQEITPSDDPLNTPDVLKFTKEDVEEKVMEDPKGGKKAESKETRSRAAGSEEDEAGGDSIEAAKEGSIGGPKEESEGESNETLAKGSPRRQDSGCIV